MCHEVQRYPSETLSEKEKKKAQINKVWKVVNPLARRTGEGGGEGGECVQNKWNVVLENEYDVIFSPPPP